MASTALIGGGLRLGSDRAGTRPRSRARIRPDEDAVTLAVEAASRAMRHDLHQVGALILATTTPPYVEGGSVQVLAELLDLQGATTVIELNSSARDGLTAVRIAAALAPELGPVLICAAHASPEDGSTGDGAVALLVADAASSTARDPLATLTPAASFTSELRDRWRLPCDAVAHRADPSFVEAIGTTDLAQRLARSLPADAALTVTGPSPRAADAFEREHGGPGDRVSRDAGIIGAAHPLIRLLCSLGSSSTVLALAGGVGEAVRVEPTETGGHFLASLGADDWYESATTGSDHSFATPTGFAPYASVPRSWRERDVDLRLNGILSPGSSAPGRVPPTGTVLTWTRDHVYPAREPVEIVAVTLDAGGQFFGQVAVGEHVAIGDRVELVPRRLHQGNGIVQYFWKARPCR
jgi:hydroxymethylglutaryl-CoA synthase